MEHSIWGITTPNIMQRNTTRQYALCIFMHGTLRGTLIWMHPLDFEGVQIWLGIQLVNPPIQTYIDNTSMIRVPDWIFSLGEVQGNWYWTIQTNSGTNS